MFTAWPFAGKGPEGKPLLQFGEKGAGLLSVVAAHPAAEFVAGGYDSGELQLAWSPDGFQLAVGNDNGDMLVVDLRR